MCERPATVPGQGEHPLYAARAERFRMPGISREGGYGKSLICLRSRSGARANLTETPAKKVSGNSFGRMKHKRSRTCSNRGRYRTVRLLCSPTGRDAWFSAGDRATSKGTGGGLKSLQIRVVADPRGNNSENFFCPQKD
jgi:hypothetical protein